MVGASKPERLSDLQTECFSSCVYENIACKVGLGRAVTVVEHETCILVKVRMRKFVSSGFLLRNGRI